MEQIGQENGLEIARRREGELHHEYTRAWNKRAHTLQLLVDNTNTLIERSLEQAAQIGSLAGKVAALEERPAVPFPASG